MDKYFHSTFYWVCDYLSILGLKLNHASKMEPWKPARVYIVFIYKNDVNIDRNAGDSWIDMTVQ